MRLEFRVGGSRVLMSNILSAYCGVFLLLMDFLHLPECLSTDKNVMRLSVKCDAHRNANFVLHVRG